MGSHQDHHSVVILHSLTSEIIRPTMSSSPAAAAACAIVYSTQTGRAKACARRTARILREKTTLKLLGGKTFDEINFVEHASTLAPQSGSHFFLFFVSATGDGVHCDTIQSTWRTSLQKSLHPFRRPTNLPCFRWAIVRADLNFVRRGGNWLCGSNN